MLNLLLVLPLVIQVMVPVLMLVRLVDGINCSLVFCLIFRILWSKDWLRSHLVVRKVRLCLVMVVLVKGSLRYVSVVVVVCV